MLYSRTLCFIAGAVLGAPLANAQALSFRLIPDNILGSWGTAPTNCASPALVVSRLQPHGFRFEFTTPDRGDLEMIARPPPPLLVGAPDPVVVNFTSKTKPLDNSFGANRDFDVVMPGPNAMVLTFRRDDLSVRYARCTSHGVG